MSLDPHTLALGDVVRMTVQGPLVQCVAVNSNGPGKQYLGHALSVDGAYFRTDICQTLRIDPAGAPAAADLVTAAATRIAAALALHQAEGGTSTCRECWAPTPCPTVVALRGDLPAPSGAGDIPGKDDQHDQQ